LHDIAKSKSDVYKAKLVEFDPKICKVIF